MSSHAHSRHRHSRAPENWNTTAPVSWAKVVVDCCLLGTLVVAPFFMGGREPLGQLVLTILAGVAAIAWAVHQMRTEQPGWKFSGAEFLMLSGIGLVVFQLTPISQALLGRISPKLPDIIPLLWGTPDPVLGLEAWQTVSLAPYMTWSHLSTLLACVVLFFILLQRVETWQDVQYLASLLIGGAVVMAAFGILQFATSNGKYFWFYRHAQATTKFAAVGGFTNANHFANFLAMSVPLQIWMLVRLQSSDVPKHQRHHHNQDWQYREIGGLRLPALLVVVSLAVTGLAILLSMSRGGIAVTFAGTVILLGLMWWKSLLDSRMTAIVAIAATAGIIGTMMFGDLAAKMIEQNVVELTSSDVDQLDHNQARQRIWDANFKGIHDFPLLGTGLGTHSQVYKLWYDYPDNGKICSHAESGYLQIGLETGLAGLCIVGALWLLAASWCARVYFWSKSSDMAGLAAAVFAGFVISLLHSVTDFVWYAPACVMVVLALGILVVRCISLEDATDPAAEKTSTPLFSPIRMSWGLLVPGLALLCVSIIQLKWTETIAFSRTYSHRMLTESLLDSKDSTEADPDERLRLHKLQIKAALDSIEANPTEFELQMHAGLAYDKLFLLAQQERDDAMPLIHLRDAARASNFERAELIAWLEKPGVLGENRKLIASAAEHFRESIRYCPIQGRSYVELASMVWTEGASSESEMRLLEQALKTRPYDSGVLFSYAYHVSELDGIEAALPYLQKGFVNGPEDRLSLMRAYSPLLPAAFFLENFPIDRDSLSQLEEAYREAPDRYGYSKVLKQLALENVQHAIEVDGLKAEESWLAAHKCYVTLGDKNKAYKCGMAALEVNPSSYDAHQALGLWLYDEGQFALAAEHLLWCHRRRPAVDWIRTLAENAMAQSHEPTQSAPAYPIERTSASQFGQ
ncbi:MAG: O-antigen ligase family protein [Planctomycetaceae bacterium]|nr:O-antigen ligase family protein [Planctomycetaceae bacterium]